MSITKAPCPKCRSDKYVFITCSDLGGEVNNGWFGKCLDCGFQSAASPDISKAERDWRKGRE